MIRCYSRLLEDFILIHLPKECGYSKATVTSYYTSMEQYTLWLRDIKEIKLNNIDIRHFEKNNIKDFLSYIETEKKVSISTRNLRKAGILSFLSYASEVEILYLKTYLEAKTIRNKKAPKSKKDFLTIDEYKVMLESVDITVPEGFKHYILLNVIYDTAARVEEVVNMNIQDFSFGKENSVLIYGKGSKYRRVYLTKHTVKLIKNYCWKINLESGAMFKNRSGFRISDSGIDFIIKKYASLASKIQGSISEKKISPHTLRRTKATHMLLNGASLPVIQRFLGHESIATTEEYLDTGSEAMIKAVNDAEKLIFKTEEQGQSPRASWKSPDILERLKILIK
jgi:integrase/recombinase XerD